MSGGTELEYAIEQVTKWADAFPIADVIIGNHDRIIMRKAFSSAVQGMVRSYNEVLGTDWDWSGVVVMVCSMCMARAEPLVLSGNDTMGTVSGTSTLRRT